MSRESFTYQQTPAPFLACEDNGLHALLADLHLLLVADEVQPLNQDFPDKGFESELCTPRCDAQAPSLEFLSNFVS
jgi:hypothetical protein